MDIALKIKAEKLGVHHADDNKEMEEYGEYGSLHEAIRIRTIHRRQSLLRPFADDVQKSPSKSLDNDSGYPMLTVMCEAVVPGVVEEAAQTANGLESINTKSDIYHQPKRRNTAARTNPSKRFLSFQRFLNLAGILCLGGGRDGHGTPSPGAWCWGSIGASAASLPTGSSTGSASCVSEFDRCVMIRDCCPGLSCVGGDWQYTTDSTCLSPRSEQLESLHLSRERRLELLTAFYTKVGVDKTDEDWIIF